VPELIDSKTGQKIEEAKMSSPYVANFSVQMDIDGVPTRLSAIDFWNYVERTGSSCGLRVYGVGKLHLEVYVQEDTLSLKIKLVSDNLKIDIRDLTDLHDYIIFEDAWIPIEVSEVEEIIDLLKEYEIDKYTQISLSSVLSLIAECKRRHIIISFDQDQLNGYLPSKNHPLESKVSQRLFPYQKIGVQWLVGLHNEGIGGLLCDEMGLGKTIQALALIAETFDPERSKFLIACPSNLVINWAREFKKFASDMRVYIHVGTDREGRVDKIERPGIVLTSYEVLTRDLGILKQIKWDLVILDEAQLLKNRDSQRSQAALEIASRRKVLLTGTPVENSLKDLWTLGNIVRNGLLGSFSSFTSLIDDHPSDAKRVGKHIAPLILRRVVRDVETELPDLVEIDEPIIPTATFAQTYDSERREFLSRGSSSNVLAMITHLTQLSCYPGLLVNDYVDKRDAKLLRLLEILGEVRLNNEKAIVFTTFQDSVDLILQLCTDRFQNSFIDYIDGRISKEDRYKILDKFASVREFGLLVINPRAGGVGLNITSANHVIHFNRQWNPQVEKQATFRAYRHGQDKTVFVHKMFYLGTIEEVINDRQEFKEELAEVALEDSVLDSKNKDIDRAIKISPIQFTGV
jgi:SNF2 family DNA or RNA helicase